MRASKVWPYHRWAEPLDMGIARTLSDDLAARIPTERVLAFPWRGSGQAIEYKVVVAVLRFDGQPGGGVVLDTRWRLLGNDGRGLGGQAIDPDGGHERPRLRGPGRRHEPGPRRPRAGDRNGDPGQSA